MEWIKFRNEIAKQRFDECLSILEGNNHLRPSWDQCLKSLESIGANFKGVVELCADFSPLSFTWGIVREDGSCPFNGGLIFHGSHDGFGSGDAPTFSVCLTPEHGWSLHS